MNETLVFGQTPTVSPITPEEFAQAVQNRVTPLGEYFNAVTYGSFQHSIPGVVYENSLVPDDDRELVRSPAQGRSGVPTYQPTGVPILSDEDYKASEFYREGIPNDGRMTEARAKAKAEVFDEDQYRAWARNNRPWGVATVGAAVAGSVIGAAPDPTNYIPVFGPAFRAANATRIGVMMARAGIGALENAAITAVVDPVVASSRRQFGEDMSFADQVMDVALAGLFGAGVGAASGLGHAGRVPERFADRHPENVSGALHTLGTAADAIANDRPVDVGPVFARAETTRERLASTTTLTPVVSRAFEERADLAEGSAAWKAIGADEFRARKDQSIDLGAVSPGDAQRLNVQAGPIRLSRGWDDPVEKSGSGSSHINERHRNEILDFKDADGKPLYSSVDAFVNDIVSNYTHIGHGDNGRLLIGKNIPGLKERIAVIELDPRQHLSDAEAARMAAAGTLPKGDFYTVRTAGFRNPGWTMRRGRGVLPRETPEPVVSRGPSSPGARGSDGNISAPAAGGNMAIRDFEARNLNNSVAPDLAGGSPERAAMADAAVGKPAALATPTGFKERAAEHGLDESGNFEEMAELKALGDEALTADERADLHDADATLAKADDYAKAYQAAASCLMKAAE